MGDDNFDRFLKELFKFDSIDYGSFELLVLSYLPEYKENLHIWLKTTEYPKSFYITE
jgi:hypothetical protein